MVASPRHNRLKIGSANSCSTARVGMMLCCLPNAGRHLDDVNDLALALAGSAERFMETTHLGRNFQYRRRRLDGRAKSDAAIAYPVAAGSLHEGGHSINVMHSWLICKALVQHWCRWPCGWCRLGKPMVYCFAQSRTTHWQQRHSAQSCNAGRHWQFTVSQPKSPRCNMKHLNQGFSEHEHMAHSALALAGPSGLAKPR